jgi:hypothetical protein
MVALLGANKLLVVDRKPFNLHGPFMQSYMKVA